MNHDTVSDRLDQAIDHMMNDRVMKVPDEPAVADLLEIVSDLRHLPRMEFRAQLKAELLAGTTFAEAPGKQPSRIAVLPEVSSLDCVDGEIMPSLTRHGSGIFPVRPANFATSAALHVALLALIGLGLVLAKNGTPVLTNSAATKDSTKIYLAGGGGGGVADRFPASSGQAPRFARQQLTPPVVISLNQKPKLSVDPTLVGAPSMTVADSHAGDPLSNLSMSSGGPGVRSGIGDGSGGGIGKDLGPGRGVGTDGGTGGGVFDPGHGVTTPRPIYSPDPPYSEEARKAKFQGTVGLWAVIGVDGRPRDLWISSSAGMGLDENSLETVRRWRFEPGKKNGTPVPVRMYIEVNFHLL
jgi:TonB family protein